MSMQGSVDRSVKAAETTFSILETVNDADGIRLTELANELDMAKSTVHRYLQTLLKREYVVKEGDEYYVGLRFLDFGWTARTRKEGYRRAEEKVTQLAAETDERAQFLTEEHGMAVYVHREAGDHAVQTDPGIGKRISLHATAAGKSILAEWSDEQVEEYADSGLPTCTAETISDPDSLLADIVEVRERGYGINRGELVEGLHAIGVAVTGPDEDVLGAISVSGPTNRMRGDWFETELPNLIMGYANEIELNLKYM